jgi:hypothetical protein
VVLVVLHNTPKSLTTSERAKQLVISQELFGTPHSTDKDIMDTTTPGPSLIGPTMKKNTPADVRARMALEVPSPPAANIIGNQDERYSARINLDELVEYEQNIRTEVNPRYAEIKESIRVQGITNQLSVTKHPITGKFIPFAGGNTRIRILKELFTETGDIKYKNLDVVVMPFTDHLSLLINHFAENELRGDVSFWEKAKGILMVKAEMQADQDDRIVTAVDVQKVAKARGLDFSQRVLRLYFFATEKLAPIGPWLDFQAANISLSPTWGELEKICKLSNVENADFFAAMQNCLQVTANELEAQVQRTGNVSADSAEKTVKLDIPQLITDMKGVAATLLKVDTSILEALLKITSMEKGMTSERLNALKRAAIDEAQSTNALEAMGMQARARAQQRPLLGAMVGVKKSDGTISQPGSAQSDTKANDPNNSAASGNASGSNGQLSEADSELTVLVQNQLREALEHFHLHQCIDIYPAAPLGYFMEVPDGGIPIKSGDAGSDGVFRALQIGMWTMLASISGQFDLRMVQSMPDTSKWKNMVLAGAGPFTNEYEAVLAGHSFDGMPRITYLELPQLWIHPRCMKIIATLLALKLRASGTSDERCHKDFQPLFSQ